VHVPPSWSAQADAQSKSGPNSGCPQYAFISAQQAVFSQVSHASSLDDGRHAAHTAYGCVSVQQPLIAKSPLVVQLNSAFAAPHFMVAKYSFEHGMLEGSASQSSGHRSRGVMLGQPASARFSHQAIQIARMPPDVPSESSDPSQLAPASVIANPTAQPPPPKSPPRILPTRASTEKGSTPKAAPLGAAHGRLSLLIIDGKEVRVDAGQEYFIPRGTPIAGRVTAGTRTIHVFGGPRARRQPRLVEREVVE
jgi:hypothetical protein